MGHNRAGQGTIIAIRKALMRTYYQKGMCELTCGELAHKIGKKSSTYIKIIVAEMERNDLSISVSHHTGIWRVYWKPLEQLPLPDRYIIVNGQSMRVADWVWVK